MDKKPQVDGSSLPFPQTPSASFVGRTMAESNPKRCASHRSPSGTSSKDKPASAKRWLPDLSAAFPR